MDNNRYRYATKEDAPTILGFILELAEYENMTDDVISTEELLCEWLFEKKSAEVILALDNGRPVGYALFFHSFSTFLGRAGIYLEDLYVTPNFRGKGYGKGLLKTVAQIATERRCGRLEWSCLDWNKPSIDFYLAVGAEPMQEWTMYRLSGDKLKSFSEEK